MADKPQEIAGINKVIAELRKLNASSKKDLIREKEARDRAEKMAVESEVQVEQSEQWIDSSTDFQRRFLAGQAKTLVDKGKIGAGAEADKFATRGRQDELFKKVDAIYKIFAKKAGDEAEAKREEDKDKKDKKKDPTSSRSGLAKAARGAAGLAAVGLGIGGFMSGMMVWSNVDAFKGEGFPDQMKNLTEGWNHIGNLDNKALVSLGALAGTGALIGMVAGPLKSAGAAFGMTAVGVGLGGFMTGIMASGSLTGFEGKTFSEQAENLTIGLNHLGDINTSTKVGLIALAGVGSAFPWVAGTAAVGMAAAGVGIGAFMTGIMASGSITGFDGTTFRTQAENLAAGLKAFDDKDLAGLSALMVVGGVLGAVPVGGPIVAGSAATGMGLIGVGIGAFIGGIAGTGDVLSKIGVTGSGLKTMLTNTAEGLKAFNDIDGSNFATLGTGMGNLGQGLADFYGTNWLASFGNIAPGIWNNIKEGINIVSGAVGMPANLNVDKRTGLEKLIDEVVTPFERIDFDKWQGINAQGFGDNLTHISRGMMAWSDATPGFWESMGNWAAGLFKGDEKPFDDFIELGEKHVEIGNAATAIDSLAGALEKLTLLDFKGDEFKFRKFASDLAWGVKGIHVAMYGGTYDPPGFLDKDYRAVTIDPTKSLSKIPRIDFENASDGITLLQRALNNWNGNSVMNGAGNGGGTTNNTDASNTINIIHSPEQVTFGPKGFGQMVGPMSNLERAGI